MNPNTASLPLVSVVIPAYNAEATIEVAIRSILEQTYPHIEIVVVDDMSTDRTAQKIKTLAQEFPNIFYYQSAYEDLHRVNTYGRNINAGWAARNVGMKKATGEWIVFQDADDASLINRVEILYQLATQYHSSHVCAHWLQFKDELLGKRFDMDRFLKENANSMISTSEILSIAQRTKGIAFALLGRFHRFIPFEWKRARYINKIFFGALDPYPGTGHPIIHRRVAEQIRFRSTAERVWPSFAGRGADRDFNFQVATTFKDSVSFKLPIYLWRVDRENPEAIGQEKYLLP